MKNLFPLIALLFLAFNNVNAQAPNNSIHLEEIRDLIGSEKNRIRVLFVGDDVLPHINGSKRKTRSWSNAKLKSDVIIVFSEETKKAVEQKTTKKVFLGEKYSKYFSRFWRGQDFLTWLRIKGDKVVMVECTDS